LILHGRRICKPKPLCDICNVRDDCDYYRLVISRERTKISAKGKQKGKRNASRP
jgi:adenine-specific DNA glycosylase